MDRRLLDPGPSRAAVPLYRPSLRPRDLLEELEPEALDRERAAEPEERTELPLDRGELAEGDRLDGVPERVEGLRSGAEGVRVVGCRWPTMSPWMWWPGCWDR
ncbi:MAG: hypothetical protein R3325_06270, partial [Thermoanaerobaculia bacterium]|nr:hypothetical protein [Thermoanaerobaculia bacterium]